MKTLLYKSEPQRGKYWQHILADLAPQIRFIHWTDLDFSQGDPAVFAEVDYLVAWEPPEKIAQRLPQLKVLFSVGAGVDQFDLKQLPPTLPVVRMIEPGLTQGMVEYVTFATLALHRDMPLYLQQQTRGEWRRHPVASASKRRVGVMGLGELGQATLKALINFGFECHGWSRSGNTPQGVTGWAGVEQLPAFLSRCDILICLLPLTPQTRGMLNAALFAQLPAGAALIQTGRGQQLVAEDLLAALDSGQLRAAVLDVTDPEPLPADDALWSHPGVWITPHIASQTQPETAVGALLDNVQRFEQGLPMQGEIDKTKGY
ncbi:glyoxylate/hydroxypyruvate reductase A [Rouxiella silvae]|uniref:Glyoxylate/hydroxypyruvate reductase A n=1 Tax=Rouxiella silvae TaxID=1646373 RepID=A0AA40X3T5_9GAMM|nr:glyoxylate/hydroxypyruvate reductase A [Rouxiella silvae]MBF6638186.1 glyoxylate/hydroxypyruvate reductase A [Rouxiella silvae]ORJ21474.1 glyoxylate/hydroxypyruvate reductase A [Rouxiella silvae]